MRAGLGERAVIFSFFSEKEAKKEGDDEHPFS